jgi:hypothetical protein
MIAIGLILLLSGAIFAGLAVYWQNIVEWVKKAVSKIKEVLGVSVEGTRTFIVKTQEGLQNRAKYYNKNKITSEWEETIYKKNVNESDVPADILAKVQMQTINIEVSTTEELRLLIDNK